MEPIWNYNFTKILFENYFNIKGFIMFHSNKNNVEDIVHLNAQIKRLEEENHALQKKNEQLRIENNEYKNIVRMFDATYHLNENPTIAYPINLSSIK